MSESRLRELRRRMLECSHLSGEGHLPSSFSVLEILYAVLIVLPRSAPNKWNFYQDDSFILSKGHASLALYSVLEEAGAISDDWRKNLGGANSRFGGHPDATLVPLATASTGSLGHGLPISVGIALANRYLGNSGRVVCLVGDGELNEGSNWEALMLASHLALDNLFVIVDCNGSTDKVLRLGNIGAKFESFGWRVSSANGHDVSATAAFFENTEKSPPCPNVLIATTEKGHGISEFQKDNKWHHRSPNTDELKDLLGLLR